MRAVVVTGYGGPEALTPADVPDPVPGPGEVLVRTAAAGVNFIDTHHRSGRYPVPLPFIPGVEGAGTVAALGPGAREAGGGVRAGDRVGWVNVPGGYAELAAVPADRCVPLPDGIGFATAASLLLQGLTAHYLVTDTHRVRPGHTVLVHAAAGGMGRLITRMAHLRGARVIGTVSAPAKEHAAREAGAEAILLSGQEDLARRVRELTGGRGVDAAYDGVGAATFDASLAALRPRGVLALYGQASGAVPPLDPRRLATAGSVFLTRPDLDHHIATRAELLARAGEVFTWIRAGGPPTAHGAALPLEEAERAHRDLEARRTTGKLLLRTRGPDSLRE